MPPGRSAGRRATLPRRRRPWATCTSPARASGCHATGPRTWPRCGLDAQCVNAWLGMAARASLVHRHRRRTWCRHTRRCRLWRPQTIGRHTPRLPGAASAQARARRPARQRPPGGREQTRKAPPARGPGLPGRRAGRRQRGRLCQRQLPAPGTSTRPRPETGGSPGRVPGRRRAVDAGRRRRRPGVRMGVSAGPCNDQPCRRTVTASKCATPMAGSSAKSGVSSAASRAGGRVWRSRAGSVSCVHSDSSVPAAPGGTSLAERRSRPAATVPASVASTKDGCIARTRGEGTRHVITVAHGSLRVRLACWCTGDSVCSLPRDGEQREREPPCVYAGPHGSPCDDRV